MSYLKIFSVLLLSALLAACPKPVVPDPEPTDVTYGGDSGADTSGASGSGLGDGEFFGEAEETLGTVIYFDFDSSEVRAQDQDIVAAHAIRLNEDSFASVRLEGHADERGSREYNIGLGERRAQAVRQLLMIQGVNASQIQTVSFGEERPEAMGSSESDYARNRRVEIKYPR
ncbi:MAG TPA: peptidoglycan-associated lipoprotein Pal [Woeseiaceae bacterium]|nr:peptidoglycan-associated lipoprotein Pal [Woeseiaceae bacterium]